MNQTVLSLALTFFSITAATGVFTQEVVRLPLPLVSNNLADRGPRNQFRKFLPGVRYTLGG